MLPRSALFISLLILAVVSGLVLAPPAFAVALGHAWSFGEGSSSHEELVDVAADGYGNIYIVGRHDGTVDFGGGPLTSAGGGDTYIAKLTWDGSHVWSASFGDGGSDWPYDIYVDAYGNTAITGIFTSTINLGGSTLTSSGSWDLFVAKFSPDGSHVWSANYGDANGAYGKRVALDGDGNMYCTGYYSGTIDLGGGALTSAGSSDIFVAKFDPTGAHSWSRSFGGASFDYGVDVAVDPDGNVILASTSLGPVNFGGGTLPLLGGYDACLARFDETGAHVWSANYGGNSTDNARAVACDAAGNITLLADGRGPLNYGGATILTAGNFDVILARYAPTGGHVWSRGMGGTLLDYGDALTLDAYGGAIITGDFGGIADFGGDPLVSTGDRDLYLAHYGADGSHRWSVAFGGTGRDERGGVGIGPLGDVILGATFEGTIDLGGGPIVSAGVDDLLLARFHQAPDIASALDVPADQGGWVNVAWNACSGDNGNDRLTTEYTVWRAIDAGAALAMIAEGSVVIDGETGWKRAERGVDVLRIERSAVDAMAVLAPGTAAPYYWYLVATVDAFGLEHYSAPAPTLFDWTSTFVDEHYFQVIAHTDDPYVYYTSPAASGHSVDNLAPSAPLNLAGTQTAPAELTLSWDPNTETDLSHYEVYRGTSPLFIPSRRNRIASTTDTSSVDTSWQWDAGTYYKVCAVDVHDNPSPGTLLGSTVVGIALPPTATVLEQNVPNPFNPTTTIGFTLIEDAEVTLRIYDPSGRRVRSLVDGHRSASRYVAGWDGRDDAGRPVASGVYFYRLTAAGTSHTKKMVLLK